MFSSADFKRSDVESEVTAEGTRIDKFTIYSPSMDRDIKAVVVVPPAYLEDDSAEFPILYTLHGYGAPYDTWSQMPKLRKQLQDKPFIYTCFDGDIGSFYIDAEYPVKTARDKDDETKQVSKFGTFFFEEFIPAIDKWYRTNGKRGVTGFSMGGCGALHYGLARPEMFTAISGLSSTYFDFSDPEAKASKWMPNYIGSLDEYPERHDALDFYKTLDRYRAEGKEVPPIYQHIGAQDFLMDQNRKFSQYAGEHEMDVTYIESKGAHNWKFWHPASVGVAEFHWEHFQD